MSQSERFRPIAAFLCTGALALVVTAVPYVTGSSGLSIGVNAALAASDHSNGHASDHANGGNGNSGNGNSGNSGNGNSGNNGVGPSAGDAGTGATNHGAVASQMGALNAVHASETAMENAAPNSRVGKVAAYRDLAVAAQSTDQADQDVADAQAALEGAIAAANLDEVVDATEQAAIDAAQADLDAATAAQEAADVDTEAALAAAANKSLTDEVVEAVNEALGL